MEDECNKILEILEVYERGSGQKINREKTNIFFSSNTPLSLQDQIQHHLGVPTIRQYEKYLGLSALVGQAKKTKLYIPKREGVEEIVEVEREVIVSSEKGNPHQGCYSSYPNLYHELF